MRNNKSGAIEMSIGTIVVIVLAMSMLILGMVLVKNIFSGSSQNVLQMNDQVKDQINRLFTEDKRVVVHLPNQIAKIKQDEQWGVPFGIKNLEKGVADAGVFNYEVLVNDPDVKQKCGLDEKSIQSWIVSGRAGEIKINPGDSYADTVRFFIPEGSPLCIARFQIEVTKDGSHYQAANFDIEVLS